MTRRGRASSGTLILRDQRIVYASEGVGELAGRPVGELVGASMADFIVPEERARVVDRNERRRRGEPVPRDYELTLALPGGARRVVECRVDQDGAETLVQLLDRTDQANRRLRLEAVATLGAAIQHQRSEDEVHARVLAGLRELGLSAAVLRAEAAGVRFHRASAPADVSIRFHHMLGVPLQGWLGRWSPFSRTVFDEGFAFTDDWGSDAGTMVGEPHAGAVRLVVNGSGLSRAVAVRLDERRGVRDYLLVAGEWLRAEDVPAMRLFGAQVAAALEAARTIAELSRHNADLAALNRIAELVGEASDLAGFFRRADDELRTATGCAGVALFVVDEPAAALVRVYDSGAPDEAQARFARVPLASQLGDVLRERLARVVRFGPEVEGYAELSQLGFRTAALIPLVARTRVVGVMAVGFREEPEGVRGRLDLLGAVGAHFAGAIESQELLSDLRRRVGELTLLNDLAMASAQLDPALLLENVIRRLCETLEADSAGAYLREGDRLTQVAQMGLSPETARRVQSVAVGEGLVGLAVQRLAPVASAVAAGEATVDEVVAHEGLAAMMAVPLLAKAQAAVGALVLARRTARPFGEGEVTLLSSIGVQLGVAVENARLFADVRRRLSDLEAVHALALRVFGNAPGDVQALLDDGCREAARAFSCRAAAVLLLDEERRTLRGAAGWGLPMPPSTLVLPLERDGLARDAIQRRAPAWSEDVTRDPRSALQGHPRVPPSAMLAVPLATRTAARGVLYLADDAGRSFTDPELALANALAGELAVGLENAELYAEARRRVEELSLLNEMGRTVAGSLDLDRVLSAGVDAARRLLDGSHGFVVLYDAVAAELRVAAGSGFDPGNLEVPRRALGESGLVERVIRERRTLVIEDLATHPDADPDYQRRFGARSAVAAPLLLRGEPLGVLVVDEGRRRRRFTDAEVERLGSVANQLAVGVENARLYAEARGRLSELSTVIDVARVVSSSLELEEVLAVGAEHLKQTLQGSACTILLDDPRGRGLRRAASVGAAIGPPETAPEEPSLARQALEARAPVTGRDPAAGATCLAVPLHVRDQPVGVALVAAGPERTFGPGELSRAMAIASQLAVAVENARLYAEARRRAEELGLLHEVGRSLVATLDIEQVLDAGARNLARMVDAPGAMLLLAEDDDRTFLIRAVSGLRPDLLGARHDVPAARGLAQLVLQRREPVGCDDALTDPRVNPAMREASGARAILALPLLIRDRLLGIAVIVETRGPRHFGPAETERAMAIANQLAVATENARLYEHLRRSYAELAHAQRQLIQQERLAALGELSAVVAHEVRNPLGVIFNSLGSLRRLLRPTGDARMLLDIVGEEADRLNRIVGDLLDFARPSTPAVRPEPLGRVVEEAVAAALAQNAPPVEVVRELDPALPPVPIDARLVRQAVLNVAVNAVQAMPRGGRLTVRTRRDGDAALLELEDTGPGIPEEVRGRIFEPFFTTKASGTGLGLAVVKRIVDGHGGEVSVTSRPGLGTTFALRFPLEPPAGRGGGAVEMEAGIG